MVAGLVLSLLFMSLPPSPTLCWLLDDVYDDYETIWELASVMQSRQPDLSTADVRERLRQGLNTLQEKGYVAFWEGVHFGGEQRPVTPELTAGFIAAQAEAWKDQDWSVPQVKIRITDSGSAFYHARCSSSFFTGTE